MMRRLLCLLGFHQRVRERPAWDGFRFRSECAHCGRAMERASGARWIMSRG